MGMNLAGTLWVRKTDGALVLIEADSNRTGGSNRSLRALNVRTQRAFWITPEGISRKYEPAPAIVQVFDD